MSAIPSKFQCDAEGCKQVATYDEATSAGWYLIVFSNTPRYIGICLWGYPTREHETSTWHACGDFHAMEIQAKEMWRLS